MDNVAVFGAGQYGRKALDEIGKENVICFIDNDLEKQSTKFLGIDVIDLETFKKLYFEKKILIASKHFGEICEQLNQAGIENYEVWLPRYNHYYSGNEVLVNTYQEQTPHLTENITTYSQETIDFVNECTDVLIKQRPLFNHVEIETYNRCNGICDFCPIHVGVDTRKECKMSMPLFAKIVDELAAIDFHGNVALFSNNEPFLDERIIDMHKMVKQKVPHAYMHLFTNGTLLSLKKYIEVMKYLDEIIIDNYHVNNELIKNARDILEYCSQKPDLAKRTSIVLRNPKEVLLTRGGEAPNRKEMRIFKEAKCTHPFRQLIIRPDGKVSLCCQDALGKTDMGDVNKNSLLEIWYGQDFTNVRNKLANFGRDEISCCRYCDVVWVV